MLAYDINFQCFIFQATLAPDSVVLPEDGSVTEDACSNEVSADSALVSRTLAVTNCPGSGASSSTDSAPEASPPQTPPAQKKRKAPNSETDFASTSQSFDELKSQQDYANGFGIMLLARLRKMSATKQDKFILQATKLLQEV